MPKNIPEIVFNLPVAAKLSDFDVKKYEQVREAFLQKTIPLVSVAGAFAEFGVFRGHTANIINNLAPDRELHLFDSFEGLPADWFGKFKKGHFKMMENEIPVFQDNVVIHKGWFHETVPEFVKHAAEPLAFIHIDSDLYESAKVVLFTLDHLIVPGTILVFDELFNYDGWEKHEYKALCEWIVEKNRQIEWIQRTDYMQVAVKVTQ